MWPQGFTLYQEAMKSPLSPFREELGSSLPLQGSRTSEWESSQCMRRDNVPHAPGQSWPTLSFYSYPVMKGQYILASCSLQSLFMSYSWHLGIIIPIFVLRAKVATGTVFQVISRGSGVVEGFQKNPALSSGM